jgi:hypothetical protein
MQEQNKSNKARLLGYGLGLAAVAVALALRLAFR